jgi:hypothetical protein
MTITRSSNNATSKETKTNNGFLVRKMKREMKKEERVIGYFYRSLCYSYRIKT